MDHTQEAVELVTAFSTIAAFILLAERVSWGLVFRYSYVLLRYIGCEIGLWMYYVTAMFPRLFTAHMRLCVFLCFFGVGFYFLNPMWPLPVLQEGNIYSYLYLYITLYVWLFVILIVCALSWGIFIILWNVCWFIWDPLRLGHRILSRKEEKDKKEKHLGAVVKHIEKVHSNDL